MASAPAGTYVMSINDATVPAGSIAINQNGSTYYLSGNTWFQPAYGANGIYCTVVPAPWSKWRPRRSTAAQARSERLS